MCSMRILKNLSIILTIMYSFSALANVAEIADFYNKGDLKKSLSLSNHYKYKDIHHFLKTQFFQDKANSSFEDITNFLYQNPNWPQYNTLATNAEKLISNNTSKTHIIKWFTHNIPKTPQGYYHYYKAAETKIKDKEKLAPIIKSAWIFSTHNPKKSEEFLAKNIKILTEEDHAQKISELLWDDKVFEAQKFMFLVNKEYKKVFNAWISIIEKKTLKPEHLFHKVKGSYKYNSGLLYAYLNLHRKTAPNEELIRLYKHAPDDEKHACKWWKLKNYFVRELLEQKNYKAAYQIVSKHSLSERADILDAESLAGWIALRHLNKPADAIKHFETIYATAKNAVSIARGAYWIGRSYKQLGKKDIAKKWFKTASAYGFTFYGALAQHELGFKDLNIRLTHTITSEDKSNLKSNSYARIAELLSYTNKYELLKIYAKEAFSIAKTDGEVVLIYNKIAPQLDLHWRTEIAKLAQQAGTIINNETFPTPYKIHKGASDKSLVYAILRQESVFDQYAISNANAYGLMQLIPQTAKQMSKELGIKFDQKRLTSNTEYNIRLGTKHIDDLVTEYNGSYIMAIANYNAGPVVKKWKNLYGDPKDMKLYDVVDWIESIPYYETRTYVQRVIENIQIYRQILTGDKKSRITQDLLRKL